MQTQEQDMLRQIAALAGAINKYKNQQKQPPPQRTIKPQVRKNTNLVKRQKIEQPARDSEKALLAQIASLAGTINNYKQKKEQQTISSRFRYSFSKKRNSLSSLRRRSFKASPLRKPFKRSQHKTLIVAARPASIEKKEKTVKIKGISYRLSADGRTLRLEEGVTPNPTGYIPRTVSVGGVPYVKAPNGRSLVRSSSAAALFASRKKRESLLNARRATKKTSYCLFFNKFGKCKNGTKCRYIHDPSKVAVCRKFLKGACHDSNCLLSHDTTNLQQTMPVCYHFLRGVCNNENCPYSHVYVNPNAQVCQAFLKGYCPDGTACKLKHTLECQAMLNHGVCNDDKCKLKHRKRREKKRKREHSEQTDTSSPSTPEIDTGLVEAPALGPILPSFAFPESS